MLDQPAGCGWSIGSDWSDSKVFDQMVGCDWSVGGGQGGCNVFSTFSVSEKWSLQSVSVTVVSILFGQFTFSTLFIKLFFKYPNVDIKGLFFI